MIFKLLFQLSYAVKFTLLVSLQIQYFIVLEVTCFIVVHMTMIMQFQHCIQMNYIFMILAKDLSISNIGPVFTIRDSDLFLFSLF